MKVLIVAKEKFNTFGMSPFVNEQAESLRPYGVELAYFIMRGNGLRGYLKNYAGYIKKLNDFQPDLVHAHYGLSGLFANLQRRVPVVTTFHGSDINQPLLRTLSRLAHRLSAHSVFISDKLARKAGVRNRYSVIPCGVDTSVFFPVDKAIARQKLGFGDSEKLVLFASAFTIPVKNAALAKTAIARLGDGVTLIELSGYDRSTVNWLLNACDVALMTSLSEGSPQFIKEAMACNRPIVSTNVGTVREIMGDTAGCYLCGFEVDEIAGALQQAISLTQPTPGRNHIQSFSLDAVAQQIVALYCSISS